MPKYVNNQEYSGYKPQNAIGAGIEKGLNSYSQMKKEESVRSVLSDPNASMIQRQNAISQLPKEAQEPFNIELKEQLKSQRMQDIIQSVAQQHPDIFGQSMPEDVGSRAEVGAIQNNAPQKAFYPGISPIQQVQTPIKHVEQPVQQQVQQPSPESLRSAATKLSAQGLPQLAGPLLNRADSIDRNRIAKEKEIKQDERENRKESQKYVDKILDSYQGSKTTEAILNQMENISEKGDLTSPLMNNLLQKVGIPLGVLNNPDSEEFEKLSNNLTRDIQKFYGSRILASEFNNFLKQIPTLNNSEEGRKRVIENLKKTLLPARFEYQAYKDILKENDGKRPTNMREQIIERMEPVLDKWADDFKTDLNKTDPSAIPQGMLIVIAPDGRRVAVPKEHLANALSQGGVPE